MTSKEALYELSIQTDKEVVYQDEINGYVDTILEDLHRKEELEKENKKLKDIIKNNFGVSNISGLYFKYDSPVMKEEIKEVLFDETN